MSSNDARSQLVDAIQDRTARVAVIGQGYVGLPLALEFSRAGYSVIGIDADPDRVAAITVGQSPTPDITSESLQARLDEGRYRVTTDVAAVEDRDIMVICVPTPLRKSRDPDISFVAAAASEIARRFRPGQLVVLESTTYPGINAAMPGYVVQLVSEALNEHQRCLNGARVLALGVAYKRAVGDTRESPALEVLHGLQQRGALVSYADPYVPSVVIGDVELKAVPASDENIAAADCVVVLTDHPDFDYARVAELASLVVDSRNATWGIPAPNARIVRL